MNASKNALTYNPVTKNGLFLVISPLMSLGKKYRAVDAAGARWKFCEYFGIEYGSDFCNALTVTTIEKTKRLYGEE